MATVTFTNFKNGLDTRRSELTTQPGALLQLQDAHINEGAEVEKRQAFVLASPAAPNTFGGETWAGGIQTFGSIYDPGNWSAPISYLRLQHPAVVDGAVYNPVYHQMTGVTCSTSFGGAAWVAATFSDGNTFVYYNGKYIPAFRNGRVLQDSTNTVAARNMFIATQLVNQINSLGSSFTALLPQLATDGVSAQFDMWSVPNYTYTLVTEATSSAGNLSAAVISQQFDPVTAVAASSSFYILSANAGGSIQSIKINFGSGWTNILSTPIVFDENVPLTAFNVVSAISNYTSGNIVSASCSDEIITITLDSSQGTAQNGLNLQVNLAGDIAVDNIGFTLSGSWASGDTVTQVLFNYTGSKTTTIYSGTVTYGANDTLITFANNVAAAIRSYCVTNKLPYTASATNGSVYLSRTVCDSSVPIGASGSSVSFTTANGTLTAISGLPALSGVSGVASPTSVYFVFHTDIDRYGSIQDSYFQTASSFTFSIVIGGGTTPYTYLWSINNSQMTIQNATTNSPTLSWNPVYTGSSYEITANLTCVITDATGEQALVVVPVTAVYNYSSYNI